MRRKTAALFDHLVGTGEERRRQFNPKRLCGLEIDLQTNFGRLLDWQVRGESALQNAINISRRLSPKCEEVGRVRHQGAMSHRGAESVNRRELALRSERDQARHDGLHE